jgi:hypothetical protein
LGYEFLGTMANSNMDWAVTDYSSNPRKFTGFVAGNRLTVHFLDHLFFGVDASTRMLNYSYYDNNTYKTINNASGSTAGFIVGASIPSTPVRLWAGYNFIETIRYWDNPKTDTTSVPGYTLSNFYELVGYSGSSMKAGISFSVMKHLAINAEYSHVFYNTIVSGIGNYSKVSSH